MLLATAGSAYGVGYGGVSTTEVKARWTAPDGQVRTGEVPAAPGARVGSTVRIWVDSTGEQTGPPLRHDQATGQAFLATVTAPLALGAVLLCAVSLTVQALAGGAWRSGMLTGRLPNPGGAAAAYPAGAARRCRAVPTARLVARPPGPPGRLRPGPGRPSSPR